MVALDDKLESKQSYYNSLRRDHEDLYLIVPVCLSVCSSIIWRTIHLICFTLGMCIVRGQKKGSVEFGMIWTCDTFNMNKLWISRQPVLCSSSSWDPSMQVITTTACPWRQLILQFRVLRLASLNFESTGSFIVSERKENSSFQTDTCTSLVETTLITDWHYKPQLWVPSTSVALFLVWIFWECNSTLEVLAKGF